MSDHVLNNQVCKDLVVNTQNMYDMAFDNTENFDPSNTLWRNAYTTEGGEGDYRLITELENNEFTMAMALTTGHDQAEAFCRGLYDANSLADLTYYYCCQAYYYDYPDCPGTLGILSTATETTTNTEDVTMQYTDENDEF